MNYNKKVSIILCSIIGLVFSYTIVRMPFNEIPPIVEAQDSIELNFSSIDFSNATIISDGFLGVYWNNDDSYFSDIAIDSSDVIHVIWEDDTDGIWGWDSEVMYANYTQEQGWSNATVISDGYLGVYWNDRYSMEPKIAIDNADNLHVVWYDASTGPWGTDEYEIMYVNYTQGNGWSNVSVVSDGYLGVYWNDGYNFEPSIAIDDNNNIHVVWQCGTEGVWGSDSEIMYANYTQGQGWSNVTVISDGYLGVYWNDGSSYNPSIATDNNGDLHVVWGDGTDGEWGTDIEIMYANYTQGYGWSNASVISDGYLGVYWNDNMSNSQDIVIDDLNNIHVVWDDDTDGEWGTDIEIMYVSYIQGYGWSNVSVISDGYSSTYWNDGTSGLPSFVVDSNGDLHVVWQDETDGVWGTDCEIMYATYIQGYGWSNASVISDGYSGVYWNDGISRGPAIDIDSNDDLHIVWDDSTEGIWGGGLYDWEIIYTKISIPSNPGTFIISSDVVTVDTDGNFTLSWTISPKANNYSIYRHSSLITEINKSLTVIEEEIETLSLPLTGYTNGTYYFIAVAFNNYGNITSNCINVTVAIPPPKPPSSFELSSDAAIPDTDGNFNLTWTSSNYASNYSVYQYFSYITKINKSLTILEEQTQVLSIPLTDYLKGTYFFIVEASNNHGNTTSNCINVTVAISPLLPPGEFNLFSDAGIPDDDGEFVLYWSNSSEVSNYSIYQYFSHITVINSSVTLLEEGTSLNALPLTGYSNGTYYFIVIAFNNYGNKSSNCLKISVEIPYIEPEPEDDTSEELIASYNLIIVITISGIISLVVLYNRLKSRKF